MFFRISNKLPRTLIMYPLLTGMLLCVTAASLSRADSRAPEVKHTAEETVTIDARNQAAMEAWLAEEHQLNADIAAIQEELRRAAWRLEKAQRYRHTLEQKVADLERRVLEMEAIHLELLPVLDQTLERLARHVAEDLPFDQDARQQQLQRVAGMLNDYDVSLPLKTRAVFDMLAREMDLGHGVDVRTADIRIGEQTTQVELLRLGRVGLYALSLDQKTAWRWQPAHFRWEELPGSARALSEAIAMAEGRRIIGLIRLPMETPEAISVREGEAYANP